MDTRHAQVHGPRDDVVREAAADLARGALVGLPTECVYGLAANGADPAAIERLFDVKRRPAERPVARLLAEPGHLGFDVDPIADIAARLARRLWPGPLTLVVRDRRGDLTGFRNPDHDVARRFVEAAGVPVLATSANLSGQPPARDADAVRREFDGRIEWILDAGPSRHGEASTVVRVDGGTWDILREGVIARSTIAANACERVLFVCTGNVCRSPMAVGLLRRLLADRLGVEPADDALEARGFRISSAGTAGLEGSPATVEAARAAGELGADLSDHSSRPLTPAVLDGADRVYVMTSAQRRVILTFAPDAWTRIALLDRTGEDIPDPYHKPIEDYRRTAEHIRRALLPIVEELT
jgi:protein-tyrosine phosphatase